MLKQKPKRRRPGKCARCPEPRAPKCAYCRPCQLALNRESWKRKQIEKGRTPFASRTDANGMTPRYVEILKLRCQGFMNKSVAWKLGLVERTVKQHMTGIKKIVGYNTLEQLGIWALEHGYLERRQERSKGAVAETASACQGAA